MLKERNIFDVTQLQEDIHVLQEQLQQLPYSSATAGISKQLKAKERILANWAELDTILQGLSDVLHMSEGEYQMLEEDIVEQMNLLEKKVSSAETILYLSGPYDDHDALFEMHVGNGGDDAEDFVTILLRMYIRFFEKKGWKISIIDENKTTAGTKSVTLEVRGDYVYGQLKHEKGQHKLYRKSPFKATDSRQTSFATVIVTPIIEDTELVIRDEDLEISTTRSSGAGGQKVNKTDSAVRMKHLPTGIVVECQTERSQLQNKQRAIMMLRSKLFERQQQEQNKNIKEIRGVVGKADFGSQAIRIYILDTPKKIKDYRTNVEISDIQDVLDGNLDPFIEAELAYYKN